MNAIAVKPSVDFVMDAPLQQLVDELHVTLKEAPIIDPAFTGYAYVDRRGVIIAMPSGRSDLEHDCIARYLIGQAFNVDGMPPLPEPFEVTEVTAPARTFQGQLTQADEALRRVQGGAA